MSELQILGLVVSIIFPVALGWVIVRMGWLEASADQVLTWLFLHVCTPPLIVVLLAKQDLATLFYLNRLEAEYRSANGSLKGFPFDRKTLEQRYRRGRMAMIERFYPRRGNKTENETINKMFSSARNMPTKW